MQTNHIANSNPVWKLLSNLIWMYFRVLIRRPAFAQMKDSVLTLTIYTVLAGLSTVIMFGASAVQSGATVET